MNQSQNEISRWLERVQLAFDTSPDFILCLSRIDNGLLYFNPSLAKRAQNPRGVETMAKSLSATLRENTRKPQILSHRLEPEGPSIFVYWERIQHDWPSLEIFRGIPFLETQWTSQPTTSIFERDHRQFLILTMKNNGLHILMANPSAEMRFHAGAYRLGGTPFEMSLPGWYLDKTRHLFRSALSAPGNTSVEVAFQIPNQGPRTWRLDLYSTGNFLVVVNEEAPVFTHSIPHITSTFEFFMRLPELVLAISADGTIVMRNHFLETTLGFPPKELENRSLFSLIPTQQVPIFRAAVSETLQSQKLLQGVQTEFYTFAGKRLKMTWTLVPVKVSEDQTLVFVQGRDLFSENSRLTAQDQESIQFYNTARLVSLGEMAAGMAHEIANPLAIISGRVQQIVRQLSTQGLAPAILEPSLQSILSSTQRIAEILNHLREFARNTNQEPKIPSSLFQIVQNVLSLCQTQLQDNQIHVEVEPIPTHLLIECRPQQIAEVLWSLLLNSQEAVRESPRKWIKIAFLDLGESVEISVTDSGQGIPVENRPKLFQPFFSGRQPGQGTGLGLAVAFNHVRNHGGELYLDESSLQTRMVFQLPKKS